MAKNKRISLLASMLKGYECALDIGTDHGLVLKEAFEAGYIKRAIASDIKEMPLKQARENLRTYPVDFVLSDGFKQINQSYDIAIIAGMGAYTISKIMADANKDITYILQANDKHEIIREFLSHKGFNIVDEHIIYDGFYYIVMVVKKGLMTLDAKDIFLGPKLQYKEEAKPFYKQKLNILKHILKQADEVKKIELTKQIEYLKSVL